MDQSLVDLTSNFVQINEEWFDSTLPLSDIRWNTRLRSSAGRFFPGSRKLFYEQPPLIEVASYLLEEENAVTLVLDTLAHEMIHYWLWFRKKPYGHTKEFYEKMNEMGVNRYNPVPRSRPHKWAYVCIHCNDEILTRKKIGNMACLSCCKSFNKGRYHPRFQLLLSRKL